MYFDRTNLSDAQLLDFYKALVYPRLVEEKMLLLLRQGRITKWFSGIGQEAIAVGATLALQPNEWILPLHRNLGVFTARHMPLHKLFHQWQGHAEGYSQGRERSFHFGSKAHHIWGMISHLGPQLSIADGIGLAHRLKGEKLVALAFTGEGGTSEGEFHEALNLAAVWELPVIFLIENNGYALSTPVSEQYRCSQLADKAWGYGMEGMRINGNNLLEVYQTILKAREYAIREQKPVLIEAMTFRMRGHEEASGTKYVPARKLEEWALQDPIEQYEAFLLEQKILNPELITALHHELHTTLEAELALADAAAPVAINQKKELADVYAPLPASMSLLPLVNEALAAMSAPREKRFIDAITEGLQQAMNKHPQLLLMGQDIAGYGGAFKITEGFLERFGKDRVRNTPLCESAVLGAAAGAAVEGHKSMVEMQFADFVTCGFNQIVNNLAKLHYRWGQPADVVVRLPTGAGVGAGPFHSQSNESWFTHTPGLKVVYPSSPADAKGLLLAALEDPNPVLFFEHKALYRSISGPVPEDYYLTPIGKAHLVQTGTDASIITYGSGVHWAMEYAALHPGISLDILDLRTLQPLDYSAIRNTAARTGRVLVLHEDTLTGGIGGEIAAWIGEHCFTSLDAPVLRCASLDTPVPFAAALEHEFLAKSRLEASLNKLLAY
ncbi:2-oxoisovalerate dehydrogenase E1 component [Chitinophaga costaii]|uniref:2-oxoisovalerate dehydrogenase E1 component n=1 Tax=Chitinophaga costaii TaxID=1335309 RepID=A0A1C4AE22_9BACT|nr:alpha-ketoacid dehydrogenase subunit alpha/beta [Chitinophaga costaii]PUZ26869.1 dehydrogenase [Chitinophaga costaii]SCB92681.1 2-oxoisovalerate dehydrogenase E1 component [Chitinophaga costaii]